MYIEDCIWLPDIVIKLFVKHHVTQKEVEEIFFNRPKYRFVESGYRKREDVYSAAGQTDAGRYLIVFFIQKQNNLALILSARDMDPKERRNMKENKNEQVTSISKARTLEEVADYWDTHSLADHWDETQEVDFEVRMQRKCRVTLTPEIYEKIEKQALEQGILPETLVNLWLAERLHAIESS